MLIRVAKSAFILRSATTGMTAWELFRLRAIGFGLCTGPEVHLAGWAAAAVLGIPTVHSPPGITTALRPGSAHRGADRTPFGWTRCGSLSPSHRTIRHRVATVDNCFAVVDIARHHGGVAGLVAAAAVLRSGQTRESLARLTEEMSAYPGIQTARWVVEHGDGCAEVPWSHWGACLPSRGPRCTVVERLDQGRCANVSGRSLPSVRRRRDRSRRGRQIPESAGRRPDRRRRERP